MNTCHAPLLLRRDLTDQLAFLRETCGFEHARCHGIFHDRVHVVERDERGRLGFHFDTAHAVYDNLLDAGLTPWVELSFLPRTLAADPAKELCWYRAHCSEPASYREWGQLVEAFGRSLVRRYGAARVRQWHFEVWNEPNIVFWQPEGDRFKAYLRLYAGAVRALKRVDPDLPVGGPATARAEWVAEFVVACRARKLPLDFVSTHLYPADEYEIHGDKARERFGCLDFYPRMLEATGKLMRAAGGPTDLFWTETNGLQHAVGGTGSDGKAASSPAWELFPNDATWGKRNCEDTPQAGAYAALLAGTLGRARHRLMWWAASDLYEEWEPDHRPYHGGRGLLTTHGHPKPTAHALHFAHRLHGGRIEYQAAEDGVGCLTVRKGRTLLTLVWNYCHPEKPPQRRTVTIGAHAANAATRCFLVDERHANGRRVWESLGAPMEPDPRQHARIRAASRLASRVPPASLRRTGTLTLPPNSFLLLET